MKPAQLGQRFITLILVLPLGLAAVDAAAGDTEKVDASATKSAAGLTPTAIDLKQKWTRHVIAAGSAVLRGSDGVSLTETSGRLTIVSGHEQGNKVSVSVRPENPADVKSPWPKVVLPADVSGPAGRIDGPEDAVFADVDRDGSLDVIVGAEAGKRAVVLFAPKGSQNLLDASLWQRMDLGAGVMRVMRVAFKNVAGDRTSWPEIVVGGKSGGQGATIGYYRLTDPSSPRAATSWTYTSIRDVGWVMQMLIRDIADDGDNDIVYTDREGSGSGLRWLESSGGDAPTWTVHEISPKEPHHKWFDIAKWNGGNSIAIADCRSRTTPPLNVYTLWLNNGDWMSWEPHPIDPQANVGECHHIAFSDVDNAGPKDLGITHSHAGGGKSGVIWLHNAGTEADPQWQRGEISGKTTAAGIKFDNLIWHDIDKDGDLDLVTSEQLVGGIGLGVIWYENPLEP